MMQSSHREHADSTQTAPEARIEHVATKLAALLSHPALVNSIWIYWSDPIPPERSNISRKAKPLSTFIC